METRRHRQSRIRNSTMGLGTPVFIENQPDYRGTAPWDVGVQSALYFDIKLLVDRFAINDFGDTHSLLLLTDSLNVEDTLTRLAPAASSCCLRRDLQGCLECEGKQPF